MSFTLFQNIRFAITLKEEKLIKVDQIEVKLNLLRK